MKPEQTQPDHASDLRSIPESDFARAAASARALGRLIDDAAAEGRWGSVERAFRSAATLAPHFPHLAERLARARLAQGQAEAALQIIDGIRGGISALPSSLRMLRATALLEADRLPEAHDQLRSCLQEAGDPPGASELLTLLDAESAPDGESVPATGGAGRVRASLIPLLLRRSPGRDAQRDIAAGLLGRMRLGIAGLEAETLLPLLGEERNEAGMDRLVDLLAIELVTAEETLPALIEAQHTELHPPTAACLAAAVEQRLEEFEDPAAAAAHAARLLLLLDESERARALVRRGLAINPLSAPLALLADELGEAIEAIPAPRREHAA